LNELAWHELRFRSLNSTLLAGAKVFFPVSTVFLLDPKVFFFAAAAPRQPKHEASKT
jgi:hypothetical protein